MWLWYTLAGAACPELVARQVVGADPTWLPGDVPTVWADGTLWWLGPDGLRSTRSPAGAGRPVGRRGDRVVWGALRDDLSSWVVEGVDVPVTDWFAVADGALVLTKSADGFPVAHAVGPDGARSTIPMPATPGGGAGLVPELAAACERALPTRIVEGPTPRVLAAHCTSPTTWLVDARGQAEALPLAPNQASWMAASGDRLAAVLTDESGDGPAHWLAWRGGAAWDVAPQRIDAGRVSGLAVIGGERAVAVTTAGRYQVRCEAEDVVVRGGGTFGPHPLSSTLAWGLATLAKREGSWWLVSSQAPTAPRP
jgi:hypothetical protein